MENTLVRYTGGKKRQAKVIVEVVRRLRPRLSVYVEPFCGALWSATATMKAFPSARYILNDNNPYLMRFWQAAKDGWDPPAVVTEADYNWYKERRPVDDPMTGYVGFAMSFGGKFFGGWARHTAGQSVFDLETSKASLCKIEMIRRCDVRFFCTDFREVPVPLGAVVYLDPPYANRTKQSRYCDRFDRGLYYTWAECQSRRATVLATEYVNPRDWPILHCWGDTVVRHHAARPPDGTVELLMRVTPMGAGKAILTRTRSLW